ncbi:MAG: hypothetical protein WEE36_04365 [Acidimicrobiia bacterium]
MRRNLLILTLVLGVAGCGGGAAGVDAPIIIDDVAVQVVFAQIQDSFSTGGAEYSPRDSDGALLVVRATIDSPIDAVDTDDWNIRVEDSGGGTSNADLRIAQSGVIDGEEKNSLTWVFAVTRDADPFTLWLRDQSVELAALLSAPSEDG